MSAKFSKNFDFDFEHNIEILSFDAKSMLSSASQFYQFEHGPKTGSRDVRKGVGEGV